ncbi:MAG: hypothetical protein AUG04_10015 [Deltaproteobacteria bacterium 13_1_20CM_2_69_21]|nr:MAG: hypothetical protein AUG04_10015 [Deltaproteobacteria bacterium 13_1_20CM_2_69_21]
MFAAMLRPIRIGVKRCLNVLSQGRKPSWPVTQALFMAPRSLADLEPDEGLTRLRAELMPMPRPRSEDLFSLGNQRLPCWLPSDEQLADDWLLSRDYYPLYHNLFKLISRGAAEVRLLEIGVRTGYIGAVFVRAVECRRRYIGVDPSLYVRDGLQRAERTLVALKASGGDIEFDLIEGYSTDAAVQRTLQGMPKFDIVHIDGDHTLTGKLRDLDLARHLVARSGVVLVDDATHVPQQCGCCGAGRAAPLVSPRRLHSSEARPGATRTLSGGLQGDWTKDGAQ